MPTLRRWFEREYARLEAEGKAALVDRFGAFNHAYFAPNYAGVFQELPNLYRLVTTVDEPIWRVVLQYYAVPAQIYWRGDLAAGLSQATEAIVQAVKLLGPEGILTLYVREMLAYAWLETDAPGYVDDVQAALSELLATPLERDLEVRFELLHARCLAESGNADEGWALMQRVLPDLDWPEPYRHSLRASFLVKCSRQEEAAALFARAGEGFARLGHTIEANEVRIGQGYALTQAGRVSAGLDVLHTALRAARHSINRAQVGHAHALIGQVLLDEGQPDQALPWLDGAVAALDGLGWLRQEAACALARVRALRELSPDQTSDAWYPAVLDAGERVAQLRSTDLCAELSALLDGARDRL